MRTLEELRPEIDKIDRELTRLFEARMDLAKEVGEYKKVNDIAILNAKREEEVLEKNISNIKNEDYKVFGKEFFEKLMELSRNIQENIINNKIENK